MTAASHPVEVDDLLGRMTLEEKCAQLGGAWFSRLVVGDDLDIDQLRRRLGEGIGHITRIAAESGLGPDRTAPWANEIQRFLVDETRLGIPAIIHEEAVAGLCGRGATQFPQAIGLASTWDPELVQAVAAVAGRQMRAVGARLALSPVLDIARDPRWGRLEETYGEDPELASRMAVAYVRGFRLPGRGRRRHRQALPRLRRAGRRLQPRRGLDRSPPPPRRDRRSLPGRHQRGRVGRGHERLQRGRRPAVAGSAEILTDLLQAR